MQAISITLQPLSAFGTPLIGDTLFGQLCWAIHNRYGVERLTELLEGYTEQQPFLIASDAFPAGYLPKPSLPANFFTKIEMAERKKIKKQIWMPVSELQQAVYDWINHCKTTADISPDATAQWQEKRLQPHNSINRMTGTTGEMGDDSFAPYGMTQTWYQHNTELQCHFLLDETRFSQQELQDCLTDIGNFGFGRDATIGLGKFIVNEGIASDWKTHPQANALMTLSPIAPQGLGYNAATSYYQLFTRFGRHGDTGVHKGNPFKNPILMADTGAVFQQNTDKLFLGQGLGAKKQPISLSIPETVQQAYAAVIPIYINSKGENNT